MFWWIVYQFLAIAHQVYFYVVILCILMDSPAFQSFWKIFGVLAVTHIFQEIFLLSTILNLLIQINQQQRETSNSPPERVEETIQLDDKLPTYDEAVSSIV